MTTPQLLVSLNGGAFASGAITAEASDVVTVRLDNTSGLAPVRIELYGYPDTWTTPAGWSLDATSRVVYFDGLEPPDVTLPANLWGKWLSRLIVNGLLVDDTTAIEILSPDGLHATPAGESTQFGGAAQWWVKHLEANWRTLQTWISGLALTVATLVSDLADLSSDLTDLETEVSGLSFGTPGLYGDGSDGALVVGAGQTVTLDRDRFYTDITIAATGTLCTGGYRLYWTGTCTNNGKIHHNGGNAADNAAGAGAAAGSLQGGGAGAQGGAYNTAPSTAANVSNSMGGQGGTGGAGSYGSGSAGGPQLGYTRTSTTFRLWRTAPWCLLGAAYDNNLSWNQLRGGTGGGGGGGNNTHVGLGDRAGGGGGGAGVMALCGKTLINNGTIECKGGQGGNATTTGGSSGGGSGGGGGLCSIVCQSYTGNLPDCSGGPGGAGTNAGIGGATGGAGHYQILAA
jgi:hypothetical protein